MDEGFEVLGIGLVEGGEGVGVDVEYAPDAVRVAQGYDDFGL